MTRPPFTLPTWVKLALVYLTALALGGAAGAFISSPPPSTPSGRVGWALAGEERATTEDLASTRAALRGTARAVFDLVVALRGLEGRGAPDWERARVICEHLHWERCERGTLEAMARQVGK